MKLKSLVRLAVAGGVVTTSALGGLGCTRPNAYSAARPPDPVATTPTEQPLIANVDARAEAAPEPVAGEKLDVAMKRKAEEKVAQAPSPAKPAPIEGRMGGAYRMPLAPPPPSGGDMAFDAKLGGNRFEAESPNPFVSAAEDRLSTFAVDVDTASYSVARRYLNQGQLPPAGAVRVEEFVNYFKYAYAPPSEGAFTVHMEGAPSPFSRGRHLLRVALKGKVVSRSERRPANLVFLVDTSGSMSSSDKLPLAKEAIKIAVKNLNENDLVSIVTYAGGTRDVLPPTPATERAKIDAAVDSLSSGGGTAMGSGMELAYRHAVQKASANVISRVIVLTDGDTNIGPNLSADSILSSVQKYVKEGVTLSTIGFGMGNYRDDLMERLADKGNGNCFYIDSHKEARKVFEEKLTGTIEVIAKDVKVQVEFDPRVVKTYRLVGYENRAIADKDFRDDKVDAGEIGAGHSVTALYEVQLNPAAEGDLATVRIRAKEPSGTEAREQRFTFARAQLKGSLEAASADFRFATAVAGTADILRHSPAAEGWSLAVAQKLAEGAAEGQADRAEFISLVSKAASLWAASNRVAAGR